MGEHSRGAVQQLKKTCLPMIDLNEALKAVTCQWSGAYDEGYVVGEVEQCIPEQGY